MSFYIRPVCFILSILTICSYRPACNALAPATLLPCFPAGLQISDSAHNLEYITQAESQKQQAYSETLRQWLYNPETYFRIYHHLKALMQQETHRLETYMRWLDRVSKQRREICELSVIVDLEPYKKLRRLEGHLDQFHPANRKRLERLIALEKPYALPNETVLDSIRCMCDEVQRALTKEALSANDFNYLKNTLHQMSLLLDTMVQSRIQLDPAALTCWKRWTCLVRLAQMKIQDKVWTRKISQETQPVGCALINLTLYQCQLFQALQEQKWAEFQKAKENIAQLHLTFDSAAYFEMQYHAINASEACKLTAMSLLHEDITTFIDRVHQEDLNKETISEICLFKLIVIQHLAQLWILKERSPDFRVSEQDISSFFKKLKANQATFDVWSYAFFIADVCRIGISTSAMPLLMHWHERAKLIFPEFADFFAAVKYHMLTSIGCLTPSTQLASQFNLGPVPDWLRVHPSTADSQPNNPDSNLIELCQSQALEQQCKQALEQLAEKNNNFLDQIQTAEITGRYLEIVDGNLKISQELIDNVQQKQNSYLGHYASHVESDPVIVGLTMQEHYQARLALKNFWNEIDQFWNNHLSWIVTQSQQRAMNTEQSDEEWQNRLSDLRGGLQKVKDQIGANLALLPLEDINNRALTSYLWLPRLCTGEELENYFERLKQTWQDQLQEPQRCFLDIMQLRCFCQSLDPSNLPRMQAIEGRVQKTYPYAGAERRLKASQYFSELSLELLNLEVDQKTESHILNLAHDNPNLALLILLAHNQPVLANTFYEQWSNSKLSNLRCSTGPYIQTVQLANTARELLQIDSSAKQWQDFLHQVQKCEKKLSSQNLCVQVQYETLSSLSTALSKMKTSLLELERSSNQGCREQKRQRLAEKESISQRSKTIEKSIQDMEDSVRMCEYCQYEIACLKLLAQLQTADKASIAQLLVEFLGQHKPFHDSWRMWKFRWIMKMSACQEQACRLTEQLEAVTTPSLLLDMQMVLDCLARGNEEKLWQILRQPRSQGSLLLRALQTLDPDYQATASAPHNPSRGRRKKKSTSKHHEKLEIMSANTPLLRVFFDFQEYEALWQVCLLKMRKENKAHLWKEPWKHEAELKQAYPVLFENPDLNKIWLRALLTEAEEQRDLEQRQRVITFFSKLEPYQQLWSDCLQRMGEAGTPDLWQAPVTHEEQLKQEYPLLFNHSVVQNIWITALKAWVLEQDKSYSFEEDSEVVQLLIEREAYQELWQLCLAQMHKQGQPKLWQSPDDPDLFDNYHILLVHNELKTIWLQELLKASSIEPNLLPTALRFVQNRLMLPLPDADMRAELELQRNSAPDTSKFSRAFQPQTAKKCFERFRKLMQSHGNISAEKHLNCLLDAWALAERQIDRCQVLHYLQAMERNRVQLLSLIRQKLRSSAYLRAKTLRTVYFCYLCEYCGHDSKCAQESLDLLETMECSYPETLGLAHRLKSIDFKQLRTAA